MDDPDRASSNEDSSEDESLYKSALSVFIDGSNRNSVVSRQSKDTLPLSETIPENGEVDIIKKDDAQEDLEKYQSYTKYLKITKLYLMLPWISLMLYLIDIGSDLVLAIKYGLNREWVYSGLTGLFVLMPALYLSAFVGRTWKQILSKSWIWWPTLVPLLLFNLEPAVQYVKNFMIVRKFLKAKKLKDLDKQHKYYKKFINGNRAVSDLKYTEALMEAIPQFTLQGYIILRNYDTFAFDQKFLFQIFSLVTSTTGIAAIIFIRHKIYLLNYGIVVTPFGRALWTSGRFFSLISRTLSMTTLASLYPSYTFAAIGVHWVFATIWRYVTHVKELGYIEPLFQGAADTLVPRVDNLISNVVSHVIMRVEDCCMMILWYFYVNDYFVNVKLVYVTTVISLDIIGAVTDILYKKYNNVFTKKI